MNTAHHSITDTPHRRHHAARPAHRRRRAAGISTVELLIALSISALLLTAMVVALNASFYAYASAAESASTQSSTRLVMQRLLRMIRNGTLHDAYDPTDPTVTLLAPPAPAVDSVGIQLFDTDGRLLRVWWQVNPAYNQADLGDLWYRINTNTAQPLLERVTAQRNAADQLYIFSLLARQSNGGLLLSRATIDITADPGVDATLALEDAQGASESVRLIGSTMPRRNLDND